MKASLAILHVISNCLIASLFSAHGNPPQPKKQSSIQATRMNRTVQKK
jgi:hypothetical protein